MGLLAGHETGRCPVSVELARSSGQPAFGCCDAATHVNDLAIAVHHAGFVCNGTYVVDFEFKRSEAGSGRQHRNNGSAHGCIEQCGGYASMYHAKGAIMILGWLDGDNDTALTRLGNPHSDQFRNGRRRQFSHLYSLD